MTTTVGHGIVVAASAFRVKYGKMRAAGGTATIHRIENLSTHPANRGRVYPGGPRCKTLCVSVLQAGWSKEEFAHQLVAVEEPPADVIRSRGDQYQSGAAYNKEECAKDELLCHLYDEPYGDPRLMLLTHNHMMTVLRAFLTGAKWELPPDTEKGIVFCDADGTLSITAVAESQNGQQLAEVLETGCPVEVLSWKMDAEEPNAASVISRALQKGHELAMRTTELSALATLQGEIIRQMGKDLSQRVAYQSVVQAVQLNLDTTAEDRDLPELFDFLISSGVGQNSYITDLLDFTSTIVDSSLRQLHFAAFGVVNKIKGVAPLTKIAMLKRSYRKKPTMGFCPNPESSWTGFDAEMVEQLEALLRYFHGTCKAALDELPPQSRIKLLANVDVAAADAFYVAAAAVSPKHLGPRKNCEVVRKELLEATRKYLRDLKFTVENHPAPAEGKQNDWIKFEKTAAVAEQPVLGAQAAAGGAPKSSVEVLTFDEATGAQLREQVDFALPAEKTEESSMELPWQQWHKESLDMGAVETDKACAVAVLQALHAHVDVTTEKVNIMQDNGGTVHVYATADIPEKTIAFPPCIPRSSKVHERAYHPWAVRIQVQLTDSTKKHVKKDQQRFTSETQVVLMPEFSAPKFKETKAAVAGSNASSAATAVAGASSEQTAPAAPHTPAVEESAALGAAAVTEIQWLWGQGKAETMHPFWAVRRLTADQLDSEQKACIKRNKTAVAGKNEKVPSFNCEFQEQVQSAVCICGIGAQLPIARGSSKSPRSRTPLRWHQATS